MISFSGFQLKLTFNPPENSDKPFDDMFNCLFIEPELNRLFWLDTFLLSIFIFFFSMSKENPKIVPQEIEQVDTLEKKEHEIILYNDDVNTFDHVIECLVTICEHTYLQASFRTKYLCIERELLQKHIPVDVCKNDIIGRNLL